MKCGSTMTHICILRHPMPDFIINGNIKALLVTSLAPAIKLMVFIGEILQNVYPARST